MPKPRMKQRRVVHKSTAGILNSIPEAVDLVGNPPTGLTVNTVASRCGFLTAHLAESLARLHCFPPSASVMSSADDVAGQKNEQEGRWPEYQYQPPQ